jgi:hypothetical protein
MRGGKPVFYDGYVKAALAEVWQIFDYPCGQGLASLFLKGTSLYTLKTDICFSNFSHTFIASSLECLLNPSLRYF